MPFKTVHHLLVVYTLKYHNKNPDGKTCLLVFLQPFLKTKNSKTVADCASFTKSRSYSQDTVPSYLPVQPSGFLGAIAFFNSLQIR